MITNGHIELVAGGSAEFRTAIIERVTTLPTVVAAERGRIVFSITNSAFYFNNGSAWVSFATGGDASAVQAEVDAIEASLGQFVSSTGVFVPPTGTNFLNSATSFADALVLLDSAVSGKNELRELLDVTITTPLDKQVLYYDNASGKWINHALVLSDVSDVTATVSEVNQLHTSGVTTADLSKLHAVTASAAEINILTGTTVSATELNYLDGTTSSVQSQLDNKQPLDAQLTSIANQTPTANQTLFGDNATGLYTLDADAGARSRLGLVIGTDVQAFDPDLLQLANFTPSAGQFLVGTGGGAGTAWVLESGATARQSLGLGDIAVHNDAEYVRVDGTHAMAADLNAGNFKIINLATCLSGTDAANKAYVDGKISGLVWEQPLELSNLVGTATAPVGSPTQPDAFLIGTGGNTGAWSGFAVGDVVQWSDGAWHLIKAAAIGDRYGMGFQTATATSGDFAGKDNYIMTITGGTPGAFTYQFDAPVAGHAVFVGNPNAYLFGHSYTYVAASSSWVEFSGPTATHAGTGLYYTGNTLNVSLGAGIGELPTGEVGVDLMDPATGALILTTTGTDRSVSAGAKLHLLLDLSGNGRLVQSSAGLKVDTNTITENELTGSVAGNGLTGGNGAPLAVVSHAGTATTVGTLVVTADSVGVALGSTSTTAAPGNHVHAASVVTFDQTGLNFVAGTTTVQAALADLDGRVNTAIATTIPALQSEVNTVEASVGLATDGTIAVALPNSASNVISALNYVDGKVDTNNTNVTNRINSMYHLYTSGAPATSHTVTHSLGSKYCNVTIVDSTDSVIIPQDIVFNSTSQLTVTFNTAIDCKVVVMGLA